MWKRAVRIFPIAGLCTAAAFAATVVGPVKAETSCGLYGTGQGDFALVVQSGSVTCEEAREVFDHIFAGKGTPIARNGSIVDGYECVGNPAGAYRETGILNYCEGNSARFELRNP